MVCKSVAILTAALLISCSDYGSGPDLLKLTGLSPKLVESGDTLQITGAGFAEGSPARISFRGDIYRPGQPPRRDVEIVVRTKETSKDAIALAINDETEQAFCGTGTDISHAMFQGTITLSFAAGADGLAPVSGTLRGVSLEIMPKGGMAQAARDRLQLSRDALTFLGLELADDGTTDCCTVATARGRSALAGIKPGDKLLQFDGVPVRAPTDLVPAGRNRMASVWVRREDTLQPVIRSIDVQGFRWSLPSELAAAFGALLLGLSFVCGLDSRVQRSLGSLGAKVAHMLSLRSVARPATRARVGALKACLADLPLPHLAALRIAQVFALIVLGALCAVISLRGELVSGELDLVLWWLLTSIAISVATLIEQLVRSQRRVLMSVRAGAWAFAHQLPLLIIIVLAMAVTRSQRMSEIVRAQGAWPNSWLIFHDPGFAIASTLAIAALVPLAESATSCLAEDFLDSPKHRSGDATPVLVSFLSSRVHLWSQSVLLAIVLFGGWAVMPDALAGGPGGWFLLPTSILLTKTWVIVTCLSFARSMFHSLTHRHTVSWLLRVVSPVVLSCAALSCSWTWGMRKWSLPWASGSLHWALLTVFLLLLSSSVLLIRRRIRSRIQTPLENYWT